VSVPTSRSREGWRHFSRTVSIEMTIDGRDEAEVGEEL
jgi:hypothetical protein